MKTFIVLPVFLAMAWAGIVQPATKMVAMTNSFDNAVAPLVGAVNTSMGISNNLSYIGFGSANLFNGGSFSQAILPASYPNVLAFGNATVLNSSAPYITSTFGKTKATMDLNSFYYGCFCAGMHGYCRIFVFAYRNNVQTAWVNYTYTWVDIHQKFAGFPMMPRAVITDPGFKGIDTLRFTTHYYGNFTYGPMSQGTFIDDISYNIYPSS